MVGAVHVKDTSISVCADAGPANSINSPAASVILMTWVLLIILISSGPPWASPRGLAVLRRSPRVALTRFCKARATASRTMSPECELRTVASLAGHAGILYESTAAISRSRAGRQSAKMVGMPCRLRR